MNGLFFQEEYHNVIFVFSVVLFVFLLTYLSRSYTESSVDSFMMDDRFDIDPGLDLLKKLESFEVPFFSNITDLESRLLFDGFLKKFSKLYTSDEEKETRYSKFAKNLRVIDQNNLENIANGGSAVHGLTPFSDMDEEEFTRYYLTARKPLKKINTRTSSSAAQNTKMFSNIIDWTGKYTTPVVDQGQLMFLL